MKSLLSRLFGPKPAPSCHVLGIVASLDGAHDEWTYVSWGRHRHTPTRLSVTLSPYAGNARIDGTFEDLSSVDERALREAIVRWDKVREQRARAQIEAETKGRLAGFAALGCPGQEEGS